MLITTIIFVILFIVLLCFCLKLIKKQNILLKQKDIETRLNSLNDKFNILIQNYGKKVLELDNLTHQIEDKRKDLSFLKIQYDDQNKTYKDLQENINYIRKENDQFYKQQKKTIEQRLEDFKKVTKIAADNYVNNIEKVYEHAEAGHTEKMTRLKEEFNEAAAALNNLKETRKAAYEAILKQKQIKEKSIFYTVQLDEKCLHDINLLNSISNQLIDSRPLNMVIWTSYYSKKVNELCSRIIGTEIKSGIYKITFLPTNQCYIGQAKDLKERIRTHIKAGSCHIDTPSNNKLYEKMGKNSIQNFTFQILEYCSVEKLNQKEKYYIDLYQSYDYGFNSNRGISK